MHVRAVGDDLVDVVEAGPVHGSAYEPVEGIVDEAARREVEHSAALRKAVIRREQRPIEKALRVDLRSVHQ